MELLNFMVGEWIGTSKVYENGVVSKECSAYQEIAYDLEKSILVIKLNSEFLKLHTIIYYDDNDKKYYYYPFSKKGVNRYPAEYHDGKLIVWNSDKKRYIFRSIPDGGFQEYGEQIIEGQWVKYFEDTFKNTK
ncbi:MAG: hypothetical protein Kapaf2KO_00840 [Candidatus Kapaibacteriales bacterium]